MLAGILALAAALITLGVRYLVVPQQTPRPSASVGRAERP